MTSKISTGVWAPIVVMADATPLPRTVTGMDATDIAARERLARLVPDDPAARRRVVNALLRAVLNRRGAL